MNPVARVSRVLVGVDLDDASASALQMECMHLLLFVPSTDGIVERSLS